jgi:E3 ubiquitin-protein ligase RAD18
MKDWQVFSHLDKCTGAPEEPARNVSRTIPAPMDIMNSSPRKQQTRFERLPALNYSILKDQALRKKLTELGISSTGSRALLERRHREWCTIWNANCDSVKPKSRTQLLHDLEVWERTQGARALASSRLAQPFPSVKDKDFDGQAWASKYNASFEDLIANARKNHPSKRQPETSGEASNVKDGPVKVMDSLEPHTTEATAGQVGNPGQIMPDFEVRNVDSRRQKELDSQEDGIGSRGHSVATPVRAMPPAELDSTNNK